MAIDTDYVQTMSKQLANFDVQAALTKANRNEASYKTQLSAVTTLESAIKSFASTVKGMKSVTSSTSSVLVNKAVFSSADYATATVGSKAIAGSYDFFVKQLATRHQLSLEGLQNSDIDMTGTLAIKQGSKTFNIDLSKIDTNGDSSNSLEEVAAAINTATDNTGVKATLVRSNGKVSLVLASEKTGLAGAISLSSPDISSGSLFDTKLNNPLVLSAAQDAIVRLGGENGMELTNASNTFDNVVDGVSMTFTKVHKSGDPLLNMTVSQDQSATLAQTQKLVTAFNTLMGKFNELTVSGGDDVARGPLAGDSSVRSIESMLNQVMRKTYGGVSLMSYGISADGKGGLSIDSTRFNKAIADNPEALEKLFSDKDALLGSIDKNLAPYTSSANGSLKLRKETLNKSLRNVDQEFTKIQAKYDNSYARYLKQYTNLMQTMSSMEQTSASF
jgi:flagellar hook-associated protein 2